MPSVLALDQGTTGSTALIVRDDGSVAAKAYREFTQHFPKPGWVEHDAGEIWETTLAVAREVLEGAGETPAAIGITNQRETVVAWDRVTGEPLHHALVWQDRRTAERCRELRQERGDAWIAERTGLVWDPYFSGTKIEWLLTQAGLDRHPVDRLAFGTIDSWLVFKLTGGRAHVTDHTNASRTLLYNIEHHAWDPELLALFGVAQETLPEVRGSSEVVGTTASGLFDREIPIAGIAGDQQAALFGQGCWEPGQAKNTYGTGAFLLMVVGERGAGEGATAGVQRATNNVQRDQVQGGGAQGDRVQGARRKVQGGVQGAGYTAQGEARPELLTTVACGPGGEPIYALEGSIFIAGAAIQWLRDGLGILEHAAESEAMAAGLESTDGVYFVPALVGLGAPHWEPEARGTIVGLTRGTTRDHLVRAALEAMAYGTRELVDAMSATSGVPLAELKADGGAAANDWLMQFQADALGVCVARPDVVETTAMGAAGLAGLATGVWPDAETFMANRTHAWFEPQPQAVEGFTGWRRAVRATLGWARDREAES